VPGEREGSRRREEENGDERRKDDRVCIERGAAQHGVPIKGDLDPLTAR